MKKITFLLLFCLQLAWTESSAQNPKKAEKHYEKGVNMLRIRDFEGGLSELEKAVKADKNCYPAYSMLVNTYSMLRSDSEKEAYYIREFVKVRPSDSKYAAMYFRMGLLELSEGKYAAAGPQFEKYIELSTRLDASVLRAKREAENCKFAVEAMKKPVPFDPKPSSKNINRFALQYFPALSADRETIIYTARTGTTPQNDENMFVSKKINGQWADSQPIAELNSYSNEGTCSISGDGRILIFTACEGSERRVVGRCDLFFAFKEGGKWSQPINAGERINSRAWESQPSLSADGSTLYFVSDRPGGQGGLDIWISRKNDAGAWQAAENAGPEINTGGDEMAPFIHANGRTLYFASDGLTGFGGHDLYKIELRPDGIPMSRPQNLGYPINDHRSQMGLFITPDNKVGYYSHEETKNGQTVSSQIYEFAVPDQIKPGVASNFVRGVVYDAKTKQRLGAEIKLMNLETNRPEATVNSDAQNGDYLIVLNRGSDYALYVNRPGYLFKSLNFDFAAEEGQDVTLDIYLDKVEKNAAIVLNNIFFETGKWDLIVKSRIELDKMFTFLDENKTLSVEISGHTDDVGTEEDNLALSGKRAEAVVEYLVKKGIAAGRLSSAGEGESRPIVQNDSPANRAKNRRIEFKIK